ncbi:hypothetical protein Tco_1484955 [Tanacetum coccineum]
MPVSLAYTGWFPEPVDPCYDEVFSTWMAFRGNTRNLGSFGDETDEITDLHQILEKVLLTERGDDVAGIKSDAVVIHLVTASEI